MLHAQMVERYIELARIDAASEECLIRPIVALKKEELSEKGGLRALHETEGAGKGQAGRAGL